MIYVWQSRVNQRRGSGKFEKRIRALEARFHSDLTILHLPDGSLREICSRADYIRNLFGEGCRVGGGARSDDYAGLRPPLKLYRRFSRIQLSR
jgi:hypothetical protein